MTTVCPDHQFRSLYCSACGYTFKAPIYCKNRFCPFCSAGRTAKIRERLKLFLRSLQHSPGYSIKFLTLTIPPQGSPSETARVLVRSFRRLRSRGLWRDNVSGGAFVLEATARPAGFHVHIHAVIDAQYVDWNDLLRVWMSVSPGRGVHIKRIPHGAAVNYLTKYLVKSDLPVEYQQDLSDELRDFRLFQLFGSWHNSLPPSPKRLFLCPSCNACCWYPDYDVDNNLRDMRQNGRCKPPIPVPS